MNEQERQKRLRDLRVQWFRGLITTDKMVAKALDVAVQSFSTFVINAPTPTLLESYSRQLVIDVAWHFNTVIPLLRDPNGEEQDRRTDGR